MGYHLSFTGSPHSPAPLWEQWESTKSYYEDLEKDCALVHITDVDEYLTALKEEVEKDRMPSPLWDVSASSIIMEPVPVMSYGIVPFRIVPFVFSSWGRRRSRII